MVVVAFVVFCLFTRRPLFPFVVVVDVVGVVGDNGDADTDAEGEGGTNDTWSFADASDRRLGCRL